MILCAGLGTRLRPLTDWCAKPLVPIGDRPALAHILDRLVGTRAVVNAHHRAADIEAFARARSRDLLVSVEPDLLGTAGGIAHASPLLGSGDILVWNGDILADQPTVGDRAPPGPAQPEVARRLQTARLGAVRRGRR